MAATITKQVSVPNPAVSTISVALDNSYPTGGYALAPSDFGFSTAILAVFPSNAGGYVFEYSQSAGKLKAYRQTAATSALIQVANAVDLSAVTVVVTAFGF